MTRFLRIELLAAALLALACFGCNRNLPPVEIAARVNGEVVTREALRQEMAFRRVLPPGADDAGGDQPEEAAALEELIDQALIAQRARELEVLISDHEVEDMVRFHSLGASAADFEKALRNQGLDLAAWKQRLRRQAAAEAVFQRDVAERVVITPRQVKDYYWEHLTRYRYPKRVQLRQVVCAKREQAEAALNQLLLGDPFEDVARRFSTGPEAARGGQLGWMRKKDLPRQVAEAAFALKPKTLSQVIESPHGFHSLRVDAAEAARNMSMDEAAPLVRESLRVEQEQSLYKDWLFHLRGEALIERLPSATTTQREETKQ